MPEEVLRAVRELFRRRRQETPMRPSGEIDCFYVIYISYNKFNFVMFCIEERQMSHSTEGCLLCRTDPQDLVRLPAQDHVRVRQVDCGLQMYAAVRAIALRRWSSLPQTMLR